MGWLDGDHTRQGRKLPVYTKDVGEPVDFLSGPDGDNAE